MEFYNAKKSLLEKVKILGSESVPVGISFGRILAEDFHSIKNTPEFERSPLDGYCFNYEDTVVASKDNPVYFDVIEEIPCGKVATKKINKFECYKILTGAKIPSAANCVIKYEDVEIVDNKIKLCRSLNKNENVIMIGEDVKEGALLAKKGQVIDTGVVGTAVSQGIKEFLVYKKIKVGFISTGSELVEIDENIIDGKIYNSNRYIFKTILNKQGIDIEYYGIVEDSIEKMKKVFEKAHNECDIIISTGGVSVGDYDLVERALNELGFNIFVNGIEMKPGMACCFGAKNGKIVLGLSGNPMSSVTTFYAVCLPAIKKMMGNNDFENKYFKVKLKNSFSKKIKGLRFLRGVYEIENGRAVVNLNSDQGNIVIKSFIGCNAMVKVENVDEVKEGMEMDCMII